VEDAPHLFTDRSLQFVGISFVFHVTIDAGCQDIVARVIFVLVREISPITPRDHMMHAEVFRCSADHALIGLVGEVILDPGILSSFRFEIQPDHNRLG
jgi:hypothetical protein